MITIKVFMNREAQATNTRVLERRLSWDKSIRFPTESVVESLKLLFGSSAVVVIEFE